MGSKTLSKCDMYNRLKICYWNIHGWSSKIIGNKLADSEFLEKISDCDIVALSEIHSDKNLSLPGFISIKQKIRKKLHGGPKISGGVGIFVKEDVEHLIQLIPNENQDSIWVKIKKELCGEKEDIFLGSFYVSPEGKKSDGKPDFFTAMNKEINLFRYKGVIIVQGDLNARTGKEPDYVNADKSDDIFGIQNLTNQAPRNSEDTKTNPRGKDLIDLCKINDLLIANGRTSGDLFGKLTSHQYNGSALNDYLLVPNHFMQKISNFKVGDFIPWLSDHCPIYSTISLNSISKDTISLDKPQEVTPKYLFDAPSKETFCNGLKSEANTRKLQELLANDSLSALNLGSATKSLLLENAALCQIKIARGIKDDQKPSKDAPWFDSECKKSKNFIRKLGNDLKKDPEKKETRSLLQNEKKSLKKLVSSKKWKHKQKITEKLSQTHSSQSEFWKTLDKLSDKREKTASYVSHLSMSNHFKNLLNTPESICVPPKCFERGPVDDKISLDELKKATGILKPGKAVAIDNLSNEMLSCLVEVCPEVILKLFNLILDSGDVLPEWVISFIVPIHKGGTKSDPSNYRGVSLLSCLGKLFLSILNNRLEQFALDKGILSPSQLGFIKGNRTSDAHIIIRNLIDKYCHKNNRKIYSCFIDLSKAFDTVPRDILLQKLQEVGIKGKVFNVIRGIYTNDKAYMKIDGKVTKSFPINQGVRQGCVLSPLLFNIFMAKLAKDLMALGNGLIMDNYKINSIFWADDIVLLCENGDELNSLIKIIAEYCKLNKLTINGKKTKCLIFNKTGRLIRENVYLNGNLLENVRQYKYLGFVLTPSGEITTGLQDLRDRAFKAFQALKGKMGESFNDDVPTALSLYDALIKPILTYASDFWGCLKLPQNNPIETFHLKVLKQVLGVQKQTTNIGVFLELGRTPLYMECVKLGMKNWERIKQEKANPLLLASYKDAVIEELPWISRVKLNLEENGLLSLFVNQYPANKPQFIGKKLYQSLVDQFHQNAFETINKASSKLRTFALLKTRIGMEEYLTEIRNSLIRKQLSKFRLSNHRLAIEVGRHQGVHDPRLRYCTFCDKIAECETHFLINCPIYGHLRAPLFEDIIRVYPTFQYLSDKDKFITVMTNSSSLHLASFIHKSFELRDFLMAKPKHCD